MLIVCSYLNELHPALRSPDRRAFAVQALLDAGLRCGRSFRLQFDRQRLERAIGPDVLTRLMPGLPPPGSEAAEAAQAAQAAGSFLDVHEELLDPARSELLRHLLSYEPKGWDDWPLGHIESSALLDSEGRVVLRGANSNEFILFALPEAERASVLKSLEERGIPADVIEEIEVDINQGV